MIDSGVFGIYLIAARFVRTGDGNYVDCRSEESSYSMRHQGNIIGLYVIRAVAAVFLGALSCAF